MLTCVIAHQNAIHAQMHIQIFDATDEQLVEYARVPIAFVVRELFDSDAIERLRRGEDALPTPVSIPYRKDYDAYPGHHPTDWPARFDISDWIILAATREHQRIGAAVLVVHDTRSGPPLDPRAGHSRRALIWDLRVAPETRRQGVGAALLRAADDVALARGACELQVETQQINVPACRLYLRHGFALESVRGDAYPELPEEAQLLWTKSLLPP